MERKYEQAQSLVEKLRVNLESTEQKLSESQTSVKAAKKALDAESKQKQQVMTEKDKVSKELDDALERLRLAGEGGSEREAAMAALEAQLAVKQQTQAVVGAVVPRLERHRLPQRRDRPPDRVSGVVGPVLPDAREPVVRLATSGRC